MQSRAYQIVWSIWKKEAFAVVKELPGYPKVKTPGTSWHGLYQIVFGRLDAGIRKFPFGVLAAQPEEVAADLVPKLLSTHPIGANVEFLTTDQTIYLTKEERVY
jgi:hypothetical protein